MAESTSVAPSLGAEIASLDLVRKALLDHDAARALRAIQEHTQRFRGTPLAPEAQLLEIDALVAAGRRGEAQAHARAFLDAHPDSPLAPRVRGLAEPR
jgi:outer membrane protein assembly factor BamD (BamD/ComL family)